MKPQTRTISMTIIFVLIAAACLFVRSQLSAITWHILHGRDLTWDNHIVTLPLYWRPLSSGGNGALTLAHAATSGAEAELCVTKGGVLLESNAAASTWQQETTHLMNSKACPLIRFESYTVVTNAGDAFCITSGKGDLAVSFVCRVVGTDWDIRFLGNDRDASEARGMVASLR